MENVNGRIAQQVEVLRDEAISCLKSLIACKTIDYHESDGQVIVEALLKDLGCHVEKLFPDPVRLRNNPYFNDGHTYENRYCVIGTWPGTGKGKSLILNAHMDTVFPASLDEWRTDPYTPTVKGGKLYGLGSADTKGGMAAMLIAMRLLRQMGVVLEGDLIFQSVVDEEAGGGNGSLACIDAGCHADAVLIAEPNELRPTSAHVGSYALKITIEGKSAHGNLKWKGVSAFEKALPLINRLAALEKQWQRRTYDLLPSPVLTVMQVSAGDGSITLPGQCELLVNYTYLPDGYDYYADIQAILDECARRDPWFEEHPIQVERHHDCGPYYTDPNQEWPALVADVASRVLREPVRVGGLPCGSDARLYANLGQMPTVVLGPGSIENAHKPNEFVGIEDFLTAIRLYAMIIYEWCGGQII